MKFGKSKRAMAGYITTVVLLIMVVFALFLNTYSRYMASQIEIKSQYTFYVELDEKFHVVDDKTKVLADRVAIPKEENLKKAATTWIKEYTAQFTQGFVPSSKGLRAVKIEDVSIIDDSSKTLKLTFSADLRDSSTEFFDSWNAIIMDGRLICEWIVEFNFVQRDSGALLVAAKKISNSDGYSIDDNTWHVVDSFKENEKKDGNEDTYRYSITNQTLNVTYDGGKNWVTVPVDVTELLSGVNGRTTLVAGSYIITEEKTAFLFGGAKTSSSDHELTVIYSDDRGATWTSSQVADVADVTAAYIQFITDDVGYVVYAHNKVEKNEKVVIVKTTNGGESWEQSGRAPEDKPVTDIGFVTESIGFVCYEGSGNNAGSMYITRDSGATFTKINLPEQKLTDSDNKPFNKIFIKYQVPTLEAGKLIAKVYQADGSNYKNGAYAQYVSSDFGQRWSFDGYYQKQK